MRRLSPGLSGWVLIPSQVSLYKSRRPAHREGDVKTKQRDAVVSQGMLVDHRTGKETSSLLEPLEGGQPALTLTLDFWPPEKVNFSCLKLFCLWSFVTVVTGRWGCAVVAPDQI